MKISQAIAQLQAVLAAEGDLEMFEDDGYPPRDFVASDASDHAFPADWGIPDRFLRIALDK